MRRWQAWIARALRRASSVQRMKPVRLFDDLRGLEGQWVALKDGRVIAARETPDALHMEIHGRQLRNCTVLRVPAADEPELVGFG
ncbi:MAG: hypothetical protein ABR505_04275 [Actinomycetota bacterium]